MTILPKKKQNKDKNDTENSDHPIAHSHHGHHHPPAQETRLEKVGRGRNSPTRWLPTGSRDEMLTHHDPGGAFECHDTGAAHNKRRHRSSPHRNVRKHRGGHSGSAVATHGTTGASTEYEDTGNNSGDEYVPPPHPENIEELERWFEETLKEKKGFIIKRMGEDGACLFRAVADQVYGDQEMHSLARKHCIDYMAKNSDFYQHYVTEDFTTYLNRKRLDSCHGNHLEMQAICEIFNRPIEVYQYSLEPINTFHGAYKTDNEPIRISYHRNIHYNSVVDPYKATIGVGLGLPSFQPGLAEKNLMRDAKRISEDVHLEKAMLEDKLRETDWEVTQETIEEQVARESYLQWLRDNEKRAVRHGSPRTASATCSSSSEYPPLENLGSPESRLGRSPRSKCGTSNSGQNSPQRPDDQGSPKAAMDQLSLASGSPKPMQTSSETVSPLDDTLQGAVGGFDETHSLMNDFPASMYGLSDWDEDEILAQVIAQSQQEYLDNLKKNVASTPSLFSASSSSSSPSSSSLLPSTSTPSPTDASCSTSFNVQNKGKS